ncbi:MAG: DUF3369 domain-containing protein [bacterium]
MNDDFLTFVDDDESTESGNDAVEPWKVLVVDDEEEVHAVTKLALTDFEFAGRGLKLFSAHSAAEAKTLLSTHRDIAIALIDVVMESDHAGLDLVRYIRQEQENEFIRIILRTGQPGQAPERQVVQEYDINDYKEKTELTTQKLFSAVYTALGSYRSLIELEENRTGLVKIIDASADLLEKRSLQQFIQGVLEQISALMHLDRKSVFVQKLGVSAHENHVEQIILAATGPEQALVGKDPREVLSTEMNAEIQAVLDSGQTVLEDDKFIGYFRSSTDSEAVVYIASSEPLSLPNQHLLEIFLRNISIGLEHLHLHEEIEATQHEIVYMLGDAVESRSKETANHVRRVAEISRQLALLFELEEYAATILHAAAPLHDVGKIGIPDAILEKPGKLNEEEWEVMKTHAQLGADLLNRSRKPVMQAGAIVAKQHHENWDGSGYPEGLKAEEIHVFGRIVAIADVFDALCSARCYKKAWPIDEAFAYMAEESGKKFDPRLIALMLENRQTFVSIQERFPD